MEMEMNREIKMEMEMETYPTWSEWIELPILPPSISL